MLKRQESSLSSSRRLAPVTPPPPETRREKSIGCMTSIIHLFSKYSNSSNKLLTFGRKREKVKLLCPAKDKSAASGKSPGSLSSSKENETERQILNNARSFLERKVPPITPEIRQPDCHVKSPETPRTPSSSLVVKLMGLEDYMISTVKTPGAALDPEDPITEKRQQLIRALDKCNEDLEGLKRIIQSIQRNGTHYHRPAPPQVPASRDFRGGGGSEDLWMENSIMKKLSDAAAVKRNHSHVLDEHSGGSPGGATESGHNNVHLKRPELGGIVISCHKPPVPARKPGEDDESFMIKRRCEDAAAARPPPRRSGRAGKVESVEEVCDEISRGEEKEMRRMVVLFEDFICKDLVEEIVKELMLKCCRWIHSLPLRMHACKRRLSFYY